MAWYAFARQTGLSPLAPGQWKAFAAVYAGFCAVNNLARPLTFGVSLGLTNQFEKAVQWCEGRLNVGRSFAVGLVGFCSSGVGTLLAMFGGVVLASVAAGVPVFVL